MYESYKNTRENFCEFNKRVINMPRHQFGMMNIEFIRNLALLLENIHAESNYKLSIINLYVLVHGYLRDNKPEYVDNFIYNLFDLTSTDPKNYYRSNDGKARNFRHLAQIMEFWGLLEDDASPEIENRINYSVCREFQLIDDNELESLRSKLLAVDIIDNPMFMKLDNISKKISDGSIFSYKPAISILRYMKELNRPVTKFEISNLLAVITNDYTSSDDLLNDAISLGKLMPNNAEEQEEWFFEYMNWYDDDGNRFRYAASQEPHFKFTSFLLFMCDLELISKDIDNNFLLTELSIHILEEDIPAEIIELERYIDLAENAHADSELANLIIYNIKPSLLKFASRNDAFIEAMNKRSLAHPTIIRGKKTRNKLIAELAKVRAEYTDQVDNQKTFKDNKGNNYVEAHHIIEFNNENGPDIVDNLLILSPLYHSLIHHGCPEEVTQLYLHLRMNNVITIDKFKNMHDKYHCLNDYHIKCLFDKKMITSIEYRDLINYIHDN